MANILIASQDQTVQDLLELSLQRFEHFIRLSETGSESIKMIQEDYFDLALFENEMPDMTAVKILKNLKHQLKTVPLIIVIASEFSQQTLKDCISAGARDFVVKPFNLPDLILRIEKMLKQAHL